MQSMRETVACRRCQETNALVETARIGIGSQTKLVETSLRALHDPGNQGSPDAAPSRAGANVQVTHATDRGVIGVRISIQTADAQEFVAFHRGKKHLAGQREAIHPALPLLLEPQKKSKALLGTLAQQLVEAGRNVICRNDLHCHSRWS